MQGGGLYFVCLALCCIHTESEPLRFSEEYHTNVRRRRSDEKDGLALSREIFKNITKHLRESIKREGTDKNDNLLQGKVEESRQYVPYQGYHHHEHHWGPYFEEEKLSMVAVHVGSEALLNCRVSMLKDKTVMWLRNTTDNAQLLTVGPATYAGDNRVSVKFQYPNNWRLSINPVQWSDIGLYMCQISTHPPRTIFANLTILPPLISLNGDQTQGMKDRFYKAGSSIKLSCIISDEIDVMLNKSWSVETTTLTSTVSISTTTKKPTVATTLKTTVVPTSPPVVNNVYGLHWKKNGQPFTENVTWRNMSASISVASASQNDSGTYTCLLQNHSQVTVNVHVLIGENQAAVHHDTWNKGTRLTAPGHQLVWHSVPPTVLASPQFITPPFTSSQFDINNVFNTKQLKIPLRMRNRPVGPNQENNQKYMAIGSRDASDDSK
ncbi:immunoglobulin domain-containing protein [Phthorimaea operculella]|nr:immunoglobulin domain-containing protein [Phthorimaea operculella]